MIISWRHVPEPALASIADDDNAKANSSPSARLHIDTCDRCRRLIEGHRRASRLLRAQWRLVTAEERLGSGAMTAVQSRIGAGRTLGRSPAIPQSRIATAVLIGLLIVLVAGAALLVGVGRGRAPSNLIVFARGGQLFHLDPDTGGQLAVGLGSSPGFSPDKSKVVFLVQRPAAQGENEIWVMASDGTGRLRLAAGTFGEPVWSPDGRKVLVIDWPQFVILGVDGPYRRDLHLNTWKDSGNGSWSPDSTRVAVVSNDQLRIVDLAASGQSDPPSRVVRSNGNPWLVRWSPDGSTIAYVADDAIHLVRPDGSDDHRLVDRLAPDPCALEWAPDGRSLAFAARAGGCPTPGADAGVTVVDAATGVVRSVFTPTDGTQALSLAWSTDGTRLAIGTGPAPNCGINSDTGAAPSLSSVGIWIVGADGRGAREVVPLSQADCEPQFDW